MQVSGDTCWILYRERAVDTEKREYDRHVLCLYQGSGAARQLELVDVREVTFDFKAVQLGQPRLQVKDLKQAWEREFLRREKQSPR